MDLKQSLLVSDAANGTDGVEPTPALPSGGPEGSGESSAPRIAADVGRKAAPGDVTPGDLHDGDDDEEVEEGEEIDGDSSKGARDGDPAPRGDDLYGDLEDSSR
jgi:hypothetical protein